VLSAFSFIISQFVHLLTQWLACNFVFNGSMSPSIVGVVFANLCTLDTSAAMVASIRDPLVYLLVSFIENKKHQQPSFSYIIFRHLFFLCHWWMINVIAAEFLFFLSFLFV